MKPLNICVIYGSYRGAREGIRAASFAVTQLRDRCSVDFVDAREINLPLLDKRYFEYAKGEAPDNLENLAARLRAADGFLIVTGEYNRSLPPGLSNLLDHFNSEYRNKPAGIMSYSSGTFGGVRAAEHLRSVVANLGMVSIPSAFPVPTTALTINEDGEPLDDKMIPRFARFIDELLAYSELLKEGRERGLL